MKMKEKKTREDWKAHPQSCHMWKADLRTVDVVSVRVDSHTSRFVDIRVAGRGGTTDYVRKARQSKDVFYSHSFEGAVAWLREELGELRCQAERQTLLIRLKEAKLSELEANHG